MASVKKNKDTKKWYFVFDYYEPTGKRRQIKREGFDSKREADLIMSKLQQEIENGEFVKNDSSTLGSFALYWLENIRKLECSEVTFYNDRLYYKNHIKDSIGNVKLQKLDMKTCQQFVTNLNSKGYARNTIERITTLIKRVLDKAIEYGLCKSNPMRKSTLPKKTKNEVNIWSIDQVNQFLEANKNRRYFCVYALALLTGMRQGEILGLRWKDIDYDNKVLYVNQTLSNYGKTLKSGAKTYAGVRRISIPNQLVEVLRKQQEKYDALKSKLGREFLDLDLVIFNLKNGGTVFPSNMMKIYPKDVRRADLPHIRFHDLRHTHATLLLSKDINVKVISERLGHSKISVTLDTYSHVIPSMQQEVTNTLEEIVLL